MSSEDCRTILKPVFTSSEISSRIGELAARIDRDYRNAPLVAICVLKGAFMFFGDLVRQIDNKSLELDFVRLSSYGMNSSSSKHVIFSKDIETDIIDKHVLIVEDIVDSGHTMRFLVDQFLARHPLSVEVAALVDKKERREADIDVKYACFKLDSGFIVGYGMDYAEKFRALPAIYEITEFCE